MAEDGQPMNAAEEAEMMRRLEEEVRSLSVADHLAYMLESLAALATRKLGLTPDSAEERDTDQARLAIDAFRVLLQVVEPTRPQPEVTAHRGVLSQLQLAYVRVIEAASQPAGPGGGSEEVSEETQAEAEATGGEAGVADDTEAV
jgi:hypothetical protein